MTVKERFLKALNGEVLDRLPVTTHHVQPYFLNKYMNGISYHDFFIKFGLDSIVWIVPHLPNKDKGDFYDPTQKELAFLESRRIISDDWQIEWKDLPDNNFLARRYNFITPKGTLSMVTKSDDKSSMVTEYLIKEKGDINLLGEYMTYPKCDVKEVNRVVEKYGNNALIRSHIPGFDVFGQPGCWQDASCLVGIEKLIIATFDDPEWVHSLLKILFERKKYYLKSMNGAKYDLLELGGGDASTTVISPKIFREFVAPYDSKLIALAHKSGQKVVYHTCGGMMPILEDIVAMNPDAMETFTPPDMGGDTDLKKAKKRIGDKVCMIGGFDQFHYLQGCTPEKTRSAVRKCFKEAGSNGGYILAPSDHFFDADLQLIEAFADEARRCIY